MRPISIVALTIALVGLLILIGGVVYTITAKVEQTCAVGGTPAACLEAAKKVRNGYIVCTVAAFVLGLGVVMLFISAWREPTVYTAKFSFKGLKKKMFGTTATSEKYSIDPGVVKPAPIPMYILGPLREYSNIIPSTLRELSCCATDLAANEPALLAFTTFKDAVETAADIFRVREITSETLKNPSVEIVKDVANRILEFTQACYLHYHIFAKHITDLNLVQGPARGETCSIDGSCGVCDTTMGSGGHCAKMFSAQKLVRLSMPLDALKKGAEKWDLAWADELGARISRVREIGASINALFP
jgi:hypothetical protein